jgi:hypothetical protein
MNRQQYLDLINPAIVIVAKKGEDYNSAVTLEQYFPFGDHSYVQMIHLKALRLVSLAEKSQINFEGKQDTVLDLINYCVFYLDYLAQEAEHDKPV